MFYWFSLRCVFSCEQIHFKNLLCFCLHSNPSCTDIMEIYNAVEEMDDDDEVGLIDARYCFLLEKLTLVSHLYYK